MSFLLKTKRRRKKKHQTKTSTINGYGGEPETIKEDEEIEMAVHQWNLPSILNTNTITNTIFFCSHLNYNKKKKESPPSPPPLLRRLPIPKLRVRATSAPADDAIAPPPSSASSGVQLGVGDIRDKYKRWLWKGHYSINYLVSAPPVSKVGGPPPPPLLLVHGFGASIPHWRRNIGVLSETNTVYAIDLLGFGASDKPQGFSYTMESWAQLILDFLEEVVQRPTVLVGNSVGSLACVIAASDFLQESRRNLVCGLVLLNCAGGMNNKAIVDDWRIKLVFPLLWLIDFLLKQRVIASAIFNRVRQRDSLRGVLLSVYGNKEAVDDELVEIIREPANDDGALDAFVSIVTGPPGPNPITLMPTISMPVLILWGNQDPFTPLDGPVGKYFASLPTQLQNVSLQVLDGVGHCPHDDRPELVHQYLLPWLAQLASAEL